MLAMPLDRCQTLLKKTFFHLLFSGKARQIFFFTEKPPDAVCLSAKLNLTFGEVAPGRSHQPDFYS